MDLEFLLIPIMESKDNDPWDCGHLSEWAAYSDDVKYYNDEFIEVKIHGSSSILLIDTKTENVIASAIYNKPKHTIDDFIVSSKYRRKGNAEKFIKWCVKNLKIDNISVIIDNIPALNLYKKCGFKIQKEYMINKNKLYYMIKE